MVSSPRHSRRPLRFDAVADIPADVRSLLPGHTTLRRWTLAQICNHLAFTFQSSLDGYPVKTFPWIVRATFGRLAIANMTRTNRIPERFPLPKKYTPQPDLDLTTEADHLLATIDRYLKHTGPVAPHPFIGHMSRETYDRYHCVHCAHHLSFAVPITTPVAVADAAGIRR